MKWFGCLFALLMTIPASAKITIFTAEDAVNRAMTALCSTRLAGPKASLPSDYRLTSIAVEETGKAPTNEFKITFLYSPVNAAPAGISANCFIFAELESEIVHGGPKGSITSSHLTEPRFSEPICQK